MYSTVEPCAWPCVAYTLYATQHHQPPVSSTPAFIIRRWASARGQCSFDPEREPRPQPPARFEVQTQTLLPLVRESAYHRLRTMHTARNTRRQRCVCLCARACVRAFVRVCRCAHAACAWACVHARALRGWRPRCTMAAQEHEPPHPSRARTPRSESTALTTFGLHTEPALTGADLLEK